MQNREVKRQGIILNWEHWGKSLEAVAFKWDLEGWVGFQLV